MLKFLAPEQAHISGDCSNNASSTLLASIIKICVDFGTCFFCVMSCRQPLATYPRARDGTTRSRSVDPALSDALRDSLNV